MINNSQRACWQTREYEMRCYYLEDTGTKHATLVRPLQAGLAAIGLACPWY